MPRFWYWEARPAVVADAGGPAFAILFGDKDWSEVDPFEVEDSGRVMSEAGWRATFASELAKASPVESLFPPASTPPAAGAP